MKRYRRHIGPEILSDGGKARKILSLIRVGSDVEQGRERLVGAARNNSASFWSFSAYMDGVFEADERRRDATSGV